MPNSALFLDPTFEAKHALHNKLLSSSNLTRMSEQYILLLDCAKRCLFPGVEAITHSFVLASSLLDERSAAFKLETSHRATQPKHTLSRHNIAAK
jgi:hypothetical protein